MGVVAWEGWREGVLFSFSAEAIGCDPDFVPARTENRITGWARCHGPGFAVPRGSAARHARSDGHRAPSSSIRTTMRPYYRRVISTCSASCSSRPIAIREPHYPSGVRPGVQLERKPAHSNSTLSASSLESARRACRLDNPVADPDSLSESPARLLRLSTVSRMARYVL